jgi:demethylmenaquinone methyltransferase/2-methoxy-6-polyprenyl-1,4-benzoquinol methylase
VTSWLRGSKYLIMSQNPERNWFGEEAVTPEQKTRKVIGVFDSVAKKYDLMNDLMSGGLHRLWKDHLIRKIRPRPGLHYLDVAGGTGDIAFRIRKKAGPECKITLCDLNAEMLSVGRDRAIDLGYANDFDWITGNAESLPLPDESADVYTIAFGLRNVTHIDTALAEAFRVLRPGGRFFCLEFSHVNEPFLKKIYDAYSFGVIPKIGEIVAKDRGSYQYLVESIRKFPKQKDLLKRMQSAGFGQCRCENLTFGVVALHTGTKI